VFFDTVFEKQGTPDDKTNSEKQLMTDWWTRAGNWSVL